MLKIKNITAVKTHHLKVVFEDKTEKTCDISQFMNKGAFVRTFCRSGRQGSDK